MSCLQSLRDDFTLRPFELQDTRSDAAAMASGPSDVMANQEPAEVADECSGKKKSKFQTFKNFFARKKKKEVSSSADQSSLKGSQSSDDISKTSENKALSRSEKEKGSGSKISLGSKALSHDSVFVSDSSDANEALGASQDSIHGKVKSLQLKQAIRLGSPPSLMCVKRTEDGGTMSEDDGLPCSPPEYTSPHTALNPDKRNSSISLEGSDSDEDQSSRVGSPLVVVPGDFSLPASPFGCLDNSAAKHKLGLRSKACNRRKPANRLDIKAEEHSRMNGSLNILEAQEDEKIGDASGDELDQKLEKEDEPLLLGDKQESMEGEDVLEEEHQDGRETSCQSEEGGPSFPKRSTRNASLDSPRATPEPPAGQKDVFDQRVVTCGTEENMDGLGEAVEEDGSFLQEVLNSLPSCSSCVDSEDVVLEMKEEDKELEEAEEEEVKDQEPVFHQEAPSDALLSGQTSVEEEVEEAPQSGSTAAFSIHVHEEEEREDGEEQEEEEEPLVMERFSHPCGEGEKALPGEEIPEEEQALIQRRSDPQEALEAVTSDEEEETTQLEVKEDQEMREEEKEETQQMVEEAIDVMDGTTSKAADGDVCNVLPVQEEGEGADALAGDDATCNPQVIYDDRFPESCDQKADTVHENQPHGNDERTGGEDGAVVGEDLNRHLDKEEGLEAQDIYRKQDMDEDLEQDKSKVMQTRSPMSSSSLHFESFSPLNETPTKTNLQSETFSPTKINLPFETFTPTKTNLGSETFSPTKTNLQSETFTPTKTNLRSETFSPTKTNLQSETFSPAKTILPSETFTPTETNLPSETFSPAKTILPSETFTPTETNLPSETFSPTKTNLQSETFSPTKTNLPSETFSPTNTNLPCDTFTPTKTNLPSETFSPTKTNLQSETFSPAKTILPSETFNPTETNLPSETFSPTKTNLQSETFSPTKTNLQSETFSSTKTNLPSETFSPTNTNLHCDTFTPTKTNLPSETFSPTKTNLQSETFTPTKTNLPSETFSFTKTNLQSETFSPTRTILPDDTFNPTKTNLQIETFSPTKTNVQSETFSPAKTILPCETFTPTETNLQRETFTSSKTNLPCETFTPTKTNFPSETFTPTKTTIPCETFSAPETSLQRETFTPSKTNLPSETVSLTETNLPSETFTLDKTNLPSETFTPTETNPPSETFTPTETNPPSETFIPIPTTTIHMNLVSPSSETGNTLALNLSPTEEQLIPSHEITTEHVEEETYKVLEVVADEEQQVEQVFDTTVGVEKVTIPSPEEEVGKDGGSNQNKVCSTLVPAWQRSLSGGDSKNMPLSSPTPSGDEDGEEPIKQDLHVDAQSHTHAVVTSGKTKMTGDNAVKPQKTVSQDTARAQTSPVAAKEESSVVVEGSYDSPFGVRLRKTAVLHSFSSEEEITEAPVEPPAQSVSSKVEPTAIAKPSTSPAISNKPALPKKPDIHGDSGVKTKRVSEPVAVRNVSTGSECPSWISVARQKQKIYKKNSLDEMTVKKEEQDKKSPLPTYVSSAARKELGNKTPEFTGKVSLSESSNPPWPAEKESRKSLSPPTPVPPQPPKSQAQSCPAPAKPPAPLVTAKPASSHPSPSSSAPAPLKSPTSVNPPVLSKTSPPSKPTLTSPPFSSRVNPPLPEPRAPALSAPASLAQRGLPPSSLPQDEPPWMALAKKKAKAWSEMPQIVQ
ncbi:mucin-2-like isoform X3 [Entelurus aequoreus]|uniref:mucin-2-like isoform X3 n=1 Tax=Entelurus aequoreus TaxID=161455 RepID=UPI002B1D7E91|nr:mucin-2-like isoform X3 [Entelurus aequoreus]